MVRNKILFAFLGVFAAASALALDFTAGLGKNNQVLPFTKCEMKDWGAERVLPGRPGISDKIRIIGNNTLDLDTNINVGLMDIWGPANVAARGKDNLRVGKEFQILVSGSGNHSGINLKDSKLTINGTVRVRCHTKSRQLGIGVFSLEDSNVLVKRNFTSLFPIDSNAGLFNNNGKRGGVLLDLKGKSLMEIEGGVIHDTMIRDNPKDTQFRISLTETGGNVPMVKFDKTVDLTPVDVEVNVSSPLKKGVYALIELEKRRDKIEKFRSIKLNGKGAKLGDSFKLGDRTATLKIGAAKYQGSKDKQTANDLVLEVK